MKFFLLLIIFIGTPTLGFTRAIPLGISQSQIKEVTNKFSGLLSSQTSNSPFALGEDFEIELTTVYQDLELNKVGEISTISSESLLEPLISIRKGLYLNLDMSFSFVLPVESQLVSGHSFNLSHASKIGSIYIKSELFISNYNVNDVLNINSSGISLIAFKKIGFFYLGLGGKTEFIKGVYEERFLGGSTLTSAGANEANLNSNSAVAKVVFKSPLGRLTTTYVFTDKNKSEASVSLGFRL